LASSEWIDIRGDDVVPTVVAILEMADLLGLAKRPWKLSFVQKRWWRRKKCARGKYLSRRRKRERPVYCIYKSG
jgi:hypothetical protein